MYIETDDPEFVPEHFTICKYYNTESCFCWTKNLLVIFPYVGNERSPARVLTAPAIIKEIRCFNGRIFIVCDPQGIYKLSRKREFVSLSQSAVAICSIFYKILVFKDNQLYLKNRQSTTNKLLLQLPEDLSTESNQLSTFSLNVEETEPYFYQILCGQNSAVDSICMVAYGRKLFKLLNDTLYLVYTSVCPLNNILPIQNGSKVAGLLLFLNGTEAVIIVHTKSGELVFEKVYLGTKVRAICAGFSEQLQNIVWFVYSDHSEIYYARKHKFSDAVQRTRVQDRCLSCLQRYNSQTILGLTQGKQILEFSVEVVERTVSLEDDACFNLQESMLTDAEYQMKKIYDAAQELQTLNHSLLNARDKLNRINLYAYNRTIQVCPEMAVHRFAEETFLSINFGGAFPKNSYVVCSVTTNNRTVFCMKKVVNSETKADLRLPGRIHKLSSIQMDLVTLVNEKKPWCLIRDCVRDPPVNEKKKKTRTKTDKVSFINAKIAALKNFIAEGSRDMNKLSEIKNSVRKELKDY